MKIAQDFSPGTASGLNLVPGGTAESVLNRQFARLSCWFSHRLGRRLIFQVQPKESIDCSLVDPIIR